MPVCVISTVGQSVFFNASEYIRESIGEFRARKDLDLNAIIKPGQNFPGRELYDMALAALSALTGDEALRRASAELNSLVCILKDSERTNNDILHFLASETPDGALAARVIGDFCESHFERQVKIHLVEGLQVADGVRFRWYGLRSLIDLLYDALKDAPAGTYRRVLNPTGGFKGVVPYLTVVGMIEDDIEVSYIYERSPDLITLAGLPLRLDFDLLEESYEALEACAQDDLLAEEALAGLLGIQDQPVSSHPTWSLFEVTGIDGQPHYALNGLGQIAFRHLKEGRDLAQIYLSRQAAEKYDKLDKTRQLAFAKLIDQVRHGEWRKGKRHGNKGELLIHKQPRADERLLYYIESGGEVVIAELAGHDDKVYSQPADLKRKDYPRFRLWEGR